MNLKVIACKVLYREISLISAVMDNIIDVTYLRQGLHNTPAVLKDQLQLEIDLIDSGEDMHSGVSDEYNRLDAILLGYGLCSNGIIGLSSKKYPLIIPRAHDCITLFLGSKDVYKDYFDKNSGTYWYTPGWIENTPMPSHERYKSAHDRYTELYGEENADYLIEQEQGWLKKYDNCAYINWTELPFEKHRQYTAECSEYLGWKHDILEGSSALMRRFLSGEWDNESFLIIPPGGSIAPSFDNDIVKLT